VDQRPAREFRVFAGNLGKNGLVLELGGPASRAGHSLSERDRACEPPEWAEGTSVVPLRKGFKTFADDEGINPKTAHL